MRILFLSTGETIVLDIIAWLIFHLSIGYVTSQIPIDRFDPNKKWYQDQAMGKRRSIYQKFQGERLEAVYSQRCSTL